jgi:hypothetical protein
MAEIKLLTLGDDNREFFYGVLKTELFNIFDVTSIEDLPENYGESEKWSLLNMITNDEIDSYQLIYVDGQFWSGSGGMIREVNNGRVYQGGCRAFSKTRSVNPGIGSKSYTHEYNTLYQLNRAKELQCDSFVLTFNIYNKKLFDITRKFHLAKVFGKDKFIASDDVVVFNGVEQWILAMLLR